MPDSSGSTCSEKEWLFAELKIALKNIVEIQSSEMAAIQLGDRKLSEFNKEIPVALKAWHKARYIYMQHILDHGCRSGHDLI